MIDWNCGYIKMVEWAKHLMEFQHLLLLVLHLEVTHHVFGAFFVGNRI